ncbi:MAG TPA: hypothetical protein PK492_09155 [Chitinophagaceae bacterium]|nr:hypothetical protein [Chitinophagaceae bacterium]
MHITITSLTLKHWYGFFRLSAFGLKISRQCKNEKGFIAQKNTGLGYEHFTLTAWESQDDLKRFARSGAHADAMKSSKSLATEIRTYTYVANEMPQWAEAKKLLKEKGKVLNLL